MKNEALKDLTQAQLKQVITHWTSIARAFAKSPKRRSQFEDAVTSTGLCRARHYYIVSMDWQSIAASRDQLRQESRKKGRGDGYFFPTRTWSHQHRRIHDHARASLARSFANQAKKLLK